MSERDVPVLRVIHGQPTEEEAAAVVTVLLARLAARERAAREAAASRGARQAPSGWRDRSSLIGGPITPGPGAWRASAFPRG